MDRNNAPSLRDVGSEKTEPAAISWTSEVACYGPILERSRPICLRSIGSVVLVALTVGYPIAVWGAISFLGVRGAALVLLVFLFPIAIARRRVLRASAVGELVFITASTAAIALISMLTNDERWLLATPVLINVFLFIGFGASLRTGRTPAVEVFARAIHPQLSPDRLQYCRRVTQMWCAFFLVNGSVALWLALFAPLRIWALYNGGIAYILMGTLFVVEYGVRRIRFG